MTILRFYKRLDLPPPPLASREATTACYGRASDGQAWLQIRNAALAHLGGRPWDLADFEREFLLRPDWTPERLWFAFSCPDAPPVGTVSIWPAGDRTTARLNWLAVLPAWQGRGLGRLLVQLAEHQAWQWGLRRVELETLSHWQAATRLYHHAGYLPLT